MRPKLLVLMGLDGSGKSTQAGLLCEWLRRQGLAAEVVWMRGESYLTRPVLRVGKCLLRAPRQEKRGDGIKSGPDYHRYVGAKHSLFTNKLLRSIWRMLTIFDLYITFRLALRRIPRRTGILVLDRYFYDSLIDIDSAFGAQGREAQRMLASPLLRLFPQPDRVYLLDIPPEEAMERKDDIPSLEYLRERYQMYVRMAEAVGAVKVDASKGIDQVKAELIEKTEEVLG
jgi:thymidylate kinase